MPRKADSAQSVPAALDAIMLDESWQRTLTDDQRAMLIVWSKQVLSGRFEAALLDVRMTLARIARTPAEGQALAIQALLVETQG